MVNGYLNSCSKFWMNLYKNTQVMYYGNNWEKKESSDHNVPENTLKRM
jgi:hypothetical protein